MLTTHLVIVFSCKDPISTEAFPQKKKKQTISTNMPFPSQNLVSGQNPWRHSMKLDWLGNLTLA